MQNPIKRLYQPLMLRVDFLDPYWSISKAGSTSWLAAAVVSDQVAQYLVGKPDVLSFIASLCTLFLIFVLPPRLAGAVGGLLVSQALISILVVLAASVTGIPAVATIAPLAWSAWCLVALIKLVTGYIQTPKRLL